MREDRIHRLQETNPQTAGHPRVKALPPARHEGSHANFTNLERHTFALDAERLRFHPREFYKLFADARGCLGRGHVLKPSRPVHYSGVAEAIEICDDYLLCVCINN